MTINVIVCAVVVVVSPLSRPSICVRASACENLVEALKWHLIDHMGDGNAIFFLFSSEAVFTVDDLF